MKSYLTKNPTHDTLCNHSVSNLNILNDTEENGLKAMETQDFDDINEIENLTFKTI